MPYSNHDVVKYHSNNGQICLDLGYCMKIGALKIGPENAQTLADIFIPIKKKFKQTFKRIDSNIESKSSNNTLFKYHRNIQ